MSRASGAAPRVFNDPKYKSTNTMKFRGQEKPSLGSLGANPNVGAEEDYIQILQQQVHFMELELRILKEKVIEDEKNSGIGSLFDDEKTSHQHIHLLKEKYMNMRKDFEKRSQEQARHRLDVIGEQFILDSQIRTMQNHQDELYNNREEY